MGCKICGRGSCTYSFHSIADQKAYEKYEHLDERRLIAECIDKDNEISDLMSRIEELENDIREYEDAQPPI